MNSVASEDSVCRALVFSCGPIGCMQGSLLCLPAAVVIFQSDGGHCTSNNGLHVSAFILICAWPSSTDTVTKTTFMWSQVFRATGSRSRPPGNLLKTCTIFKGMLRIKNSNYFMILSFLESLFSKCTFTLGRCKEGMKINQMTSAKLSPT